MSDSTVELSLCIHGSPPYGFRIAGGDGEPVTVARIRNGSKAEQAGLRERDLILAVNNVICKNLSYDSVFELTEFDEDQLPLVVLRGTECVHTWREACEKLKGKMRMLEEVEVREMLKRKQRHEDRFESPLERQVFHLQTPQKKTIVSSSPVNIMIGGREIQIESKPSDVIHVPLNIESGPRVIVKENIRPIRKEESYSYSSQTFGDALPKITQTFVSHNNFKLAEAVTDKLDSALNASMFFDPPNQQTQRENNAGKFQTNFNVTQSYDSKEVPLPKQESIEIPIVKETPNKYQSVAKLNMASKKAPEESYSNKPLQKPLEGFLIKQNDKPVKKGQEENLNFQTTKMFTDYQPTAPEPSLSYQPMFKTSDLHKEPPKPQQQTDYPFMNFSNEFQQPKPKSSFEEMIEAEYMTPKFAAPPQHQESIQKASETAPLKLANSHPPPPPPLMQPEPHSKLTNTPKTFEGSQKAPEAGKDNVNAKVALAKNVAMSVMSEENQNSKGQRMFLLRRQHSEKWTIQGPDPKPPQTQNPSLKQTMNSTLNPKESKVVENGDVQESRNQDYKVPKMPWEGKSTDVSQPSNQPYYNMTPPNPPHFYHPPANLPSQQPPMDPHYHYYHPWSPPSFPYPHSYPHHPEILPSQPYHYHHMSYQGYPSSHPAPHYSHPYAPSYPYHPPHPYVHTYPPVPHSTASYYPQPPKPPTNPPTHPPPSFAPPSQQSNQPSNQSQAIVDYCDL